MIFLLVRQIDSPTESNQWFYGDVDSPILYFLAVFSHTNHCYYSTVEPNTQQPTALLALFLLFIGVMKQWYS